MRVPRMLAVVLAVALAAGCSTTPGSPPPHHRAAAAAATPSVLLTPSAAASVSSSSPPSSPRSSPPPATSVPASPVPASPAQSPGVISSRTLTLGARGPAVRELQHRLAALRYYPGKADGRFGPDTLEAVWVFQEVQGLRPSVEVNNAMERALASPRAPRVLVPHGGPLRVEVNLAREVLVLYKAGKPVLISHVSTGGGYYYCSPGGSCGYAVTPAGNFSTVTYLPGWVTVPLGLMYNPVFFIGRAYAIHGDTDVPLEPASHGCVRIPMDIAAFFHTLLPTTGTPVYIRH